MRSRTGLIAIMHEPVDSSPVDMFIEILPPDLRIDITVGFCPGALLDNAVVHVDNIKTTIGPRSSIHRTEIHIGGSQEFPFVVSIFENDLTSAVDGLCPPDQSAYRFTDKKIPYHTGRQAVAAKNGLSAAACKMIERAVCTKPFLSALHIRRCNDRPYRIEITRALIVQIEAAIYRVLLEIEGRRFSSSRRKIEAPEIILGKSPLSAR